MLKTEGSPIQAAVRAIHTAQRVVVATGAGMSRESGIPTFREALTGLWARYDPEQLATEAAFRRHPARVFGWYAWRRRLVRAAVPHAGDHALVRLEGLGPELAIVTQNVDGLHRRGGGRRGGGGGRAAPRGSGAGAPPPAPAGRGAAAAGGNGGWAA